MTYVFDLETDLSGDSFTDALGTEIIEFAIGYDIDAGHAIIMSVMLVPGGSFLDPPVEGVYDLRFGIRQRDMEHSWKVTGPDYTRDAVESYIPKGQRAAVKDQLINAIKALVAGTMPVGLTMETYYPNVPEKALGKYNGICDSIAELGYKLEDQFKDGTNGKNYWFLKRVD